MDEWMLNDLLECSVCLERLDTSSKVLPCQHTFCKRCLEEILLTHKELRCPECRILVDVKIDELPPNVLLMRILEGMRNAGNPVPKKTGLLVHKQPGAQMQLSSFAPTPPSQSSIQVGENNRPHTAPKQNASPKQAFARAVYDYISKESGDLSFKKGDIIVLHRKIDSQWCQGECDGKTGVFPLTYVQVINPLRNHTATCKALYDFRMSNDEEEGCLTFHKDEIITVIRRVDENWAEGRLNDRIGIFPLTFVEMNNVARALMKLSTNSQPGPSRVAPPTPTSEESTPLIPTDHSNRVATVPPSQAAAVVGTTAPPANHNSLVGTAQPQQPPQGPPAANGPNPAVTNGMGSESSSTVSSGGSTPSSSSNTSSSSSSTAPSSPASPPSAPRPAPNPFRPHPMILQTSHITAAPHVLPTSHITTQGGQARGAPPPRPARPPQVPEDGFQQREKRHSFSVLTPSHHSCQTSNRHSAEILSGEPGGAGVPPPAEGPQPPPQLTRHGSQRHKRSGSDLSATHLPATYIALYPYKPQKVDELELKKGGVYLVSERCQDGWFKGTSNRTQKCGVFPGNYVTLAKPIQSGQARVAAAPRDSATPPPDHKAHHKTRSSGSFTARAVAAASLAPPELPPRAPSPRRVSTSWHSDSPAGQGVDLLTGQPPPSKAEGPVGPVGRHVGSLLSTAVSPPPNVTVAATPTKAAEKTKEKKEKSSLMKRLTGMKRSKSPPAAAPSYSMDNPVFDDSPSVTASPTHASHATHGPHPVHARSGSCPTQLIQLPQLPPEGSPLRHLQGSARLRHKDRPSLASLALANATRGVENGAVAALATSGVSSHRKSNSLDAGDVRKSRQLVPPVRERFRCIVPYPPNSEHELELRVGDIIYVHRKREDGWYKGTQQRTGQTGLFPASFVETY